MSFMWCVLNDTKVHKIGAQGWIYNIQTLQNWFQDRRARGRDVTVELRKSKRDDTLTKKRQIEGLTADSTDDEDALRENLSTASMFYFICSWSNDF